MGFDNYFRSYLRFDIVIDITDGENIVVDKLPYSEIENSVPIDCTVIEDKNDNGD